MTEEKARENIAANVRRRLDDRGLSQAELARRAGESVMNISRVCRGAVNPSISLVAKVAEALDISVDMLLQDPPKENSRRSA